MSSGFGGRDTALEFLCPLCPGDVISTNSGSLGIKSLVESLGGRKYGYCPTLECKVTNSEASLAATSVTISGPTSSRMRGRRGLLADQGRERGGCGLWLSARAREAEVSFSLARDLGPQLLAAVLQRLHGRSSSVYRHCRSDRGYKMEQGTFAFNSRQRAHLYVPTFPWGLFPLLLLELRCGGYTFWEISSSGNF